MSASKAPRGSEVMSAKVYPRVLPPDADGVEDAMRAAARTLGGQPSEPSEASMAPSVRFDDAWKYSDVAMGIGSAPGLLPEEEVCPVAHMTFYARLPECPWCEGTSDGGKHGGTVVI